MANEEVYDDELGIDIEVFVKEGEVFQVSVKGQPARARVFDYDVTFPCTASSLKVDTDGDHYIETIV